MSPIEKLKDIAKLCEYHLYNLADQKIDKLYEQWTQGDIELSEYEVEWMFGLIDKISIAIYG